MTVEKITSPITPNELIDKTNEIIDNLGGGGVAPVWGNITGTLSSQTDLQNALNAKQDTLVSGTNIKTINGQSVLGSGNLQTPYRNIGEIVESILPLTDAGLHLLDGTRLSGDGIYKGFVDYVAELYAESSKKSNVTKVGSLTDNNGVLSGFSTSNYATLPNSVSLGNNFEICVKFTTGNDVTSEQKILRINVNYSFALGINSSGVLDFNIGDGTQWLNPSKTLQTLDANTTYWFKITFNGSRYSLLYSTDGNTFTEGGYLDNTAIVPSALLLVGVGQNANSPWLGSIDLKESYININGSRWWTGANPSWTVDETAWQSSVTTYGVCGKFVYDSVNNTVRLPKVTGIIEGTTDLNALGDLVQAGLPIHTHTRGTMNITGNLSSTSQITIGTVTGTGALSISSGSTNKYQNETTNTANRYNKISFTASNSWTGSTSSPNYTDNIQNSSTVQPQTIKCFIYIVIANSTKTEIQVDIDQVATDLNSKADTDLTNVTDTAKIMMASMGMPSNTYRSLTLGASGTSYTAPADGWFCVEKYGNTSQYLLMSSSHLGVRLYAPNYNNAPVTGIIPVRKGETLKIRYDVAGSTISFRFIYAVGSESEAS